MTRIHNELFVAQTARDRRVADLVARRLRRIGYDIEWVGMTDRYGARLTRPDIKCGHVHILARPLGYRPRPLDALYMQSDPLAYLQIGSDIDALIVHLELHA